MVTSLVIACALLLLWLGYGIGTLVESRRHDDADWKLRAYGERKRREQVEDWLTDTSERLTAAHETILEMRRDGFAPPPKPGEVPESPPMPEPVMEALLDRARPGTPTWQGLTDYIAPLLEAGLDEESIAKRVRDGDTNVDAWLE